jgi:hypothetical protein
MPCWHRWNAYHLPAEQLAVSRTIDQLISAITLDEKISMLRRACSTAGLAHVSYRQPIGILTPKR